MEAESFIAAYRQKRDGGRSLDESYRGKRRSRPPAGPYCCLLEPLERCSIESIQEIWLALAEQDELYPAVCIRWIHEDDAMRASDMLMRAFFGPMMERRVFGPTALVLYQGWGIWYASIFHPLEGPKRPKLISAQKVNRMLHSRGYGICDTPKRVEH